MHALDTLSAEDLGDFLWNSVVFRGANVESKRACAPQDQTVKKIVFSRREGKVQGGSIYQARMRHISTDPFSPMPLGRLRVNPGDDTGATTLIP